MSEKFELGLSRQGSPSYRVLRTAHRGLLRRFLWSLDEPEAASKARLERVVGLGRGTRFGREHGLDGVKTLHDYRQAVPVRTHTELRPWLDEVVAGERRVLCREPTRMLLETSGTTGSPKLLPVTDSWSRSVSEAQALWVLSMLEDHPGLAQTKALTIVSSAESSRTESGIPIGSNTGRMHCAQPWWIRARYPVPYEAFCLEDPIHRQYAILRFALQERIGSITTANPSTLLLISRRLQEWRKPLARDLSQGTLREGPASSLDSAQRARLEKRLVRARVPADWRPASIWPLQLINCWKGGPARYFHSLLPEALGADLPMREVGVTASEGYFALPLGDAWDGGVLWNLGHFMEFILPNGDVCSSWDLEPGMRGRMVISTEAGLYRYDLADDIEVVGMCRSTAVIRFVGKSGRYLNSTGEKVSEAQVSEAMKRAAQVTGQRPSGLTCRLSWGEVPCLELAVEGSPDLAPLAIAFEEALCSLNGEYRDKRRSERIGPCLTRELPSGAYQRYRERRVAEGAPEGQVKDPIIAVSDDEWAAICEPKGGVA